MKKEIVDNETDKYTMAQFLNETLEETKQALSISTGYFNVEGFAKLRQRLWEVIRVDGFSFRLLFGQETTSKSESARADLTGAIAEIGLTDELNGLAINEQTSDNVDNLISFLKREQVQVRKTPNRFNHAKCYIFDNSAVVGSSNLTKAGLSTNIELNAVLYQPSAQQQVREWFERRWGEAADAKSELIQLLEDSKFGLPIEPYTMYMKFLYEYYKPRLEELEREHGKIVELTLFQQDAVATATRIIRKHNGVLIADSTGLGKTHIGLELLREFVAVKRKKALLVAPAQVLDTVWEPKLLEESIKTKNVTLESTGTANFHPEDFLDFDLVLIDESHNYRNSSRNRYTNLMKILLGGKRKQVILMTATPIHNSLMDLYRQLSLITAADDNYFANLGIPDLKRYFIAADRKQLTSGVEDLVRLLDELMIRRTRQFILENYVGVELHGKPIRFPKRNLEKVEYSLTELFGGAVYAQVLETIDKLKLTPYRITSYAATTEAQEKEESELLVSLQKIGLLKRFESSVEAIRKSIEYLIKFYEYFGDALSKGRVLDVKTFRRIMTEMRMLDEEDDESFFRATEQAALVPLTAEYDRAAIKDDVASDLALLQSLKQNLTKIQPYADRKLTALKEQIVKDNVFDSGGRKAIIFTQFVDTAKYLYRELTDSLRKEGKEVRLLTGQTDPDTRKRVIESFAPRANPGARFEKEIDLLISTDILSEGQNLQDCNYVVNYDLPWNPMRIVQRVGRVDRLGSEYETVKSVVFLPEKELEEILKLLEKLEEKIQKAQAVGTEATILGEKENPKNFNAVSRIRAQDQTLMDDLERGLELLPSQTPYQNVLSYLKQMGAKSLEAIPLGKRSGKRDEDNGVVIFYREKEDLEGMHLLFYSYDTERFQHHNDVTWIFRKIGCNEEEQMWIPFKSAEAFRLFALLDSQARKEIVTAANVPYDAKTAQKIKPRNQRELAQLLLDAFSRGKVSKEQVLPIYETVNGENLIAWENDFAQLLEEYQQQQDISSLLTSVELLLQKYKIGARERHRLRTLEPSDLDIIGFMFLGNEKLKQRLQIAPVQNA